jgi:hypothetical protein
LTAFIIESYKTLSPDQGAITIALLAQISRQLDAGLNATSADVAAFQSFSPTSSSLACNMLWFLSLGFSLSCALIATLVEQWSRDFIQKTEMNPSPIIRARIFSYLYFGIQQFGMHTVVAFIPFLLHISLLLFFAGLVVFLQPINTVLMITAAVLLGLMSSTYGYLTILPIFSSDSPYRTPLSVVAWGLFRRVWSPFYMLWKSPADEESTTVFGEFPIAHKPSPTMVEVMKQDAVRKSSERDERDARVMVWTVRSLTDNNELDPVAEALPDLIWGPNGRRRAYDDMINMLLDTPDIHLVPRLEGLLRSCDSGLLAPAVETYRRIICIKALWSIAYFVASDVSTRHSFPVFEHKTLKAQLSGGASTLVKLHLTSTYSLVQWCGFCSISALFRELRPGGNTSGAVKDLRIRLKMIQTQANRYGLPDVIAPLISEDGRVDISRVDDAFRCFGYSAYDILIEYLNNSANLEDSPYGFEPTYSMMEQIHHGNVPPPDSRVQMNLKVAFIRIIAINKDELPKDSVAHHIDIIVDIILHLLQTPGTDSASLDPMFTGALTSYLTSEDSESSVDPIFTDALTSYLAARPHAEALKRAFGRCDRKWLGTLLTKNLAPGRLSIEKTLYLIWLLCIQTSPSVASFDEETLAAASTSPHSEFAIAI